MATLNFRRAVAGAYLSAPDYNWNFDQIETYMGDVTEDIIEQVEEVVSGAVISVGTIIFYDKSTPPTGYLICDGSTISEDDYPELYAIIGGTLPKLTEGTFVKGSTTVGTSSTSITSGSSPVTIPGYVAELQTVTLGYHTHSVGVKSLTLLPCIKY